MALPSTLARGKSTLPQVPEREEALSAIESGDKPSSSAKSLSLASASSLSKPAGEVELMEPESALVPALAGEPIPAYQTREDQLIAAHQVKIAKQQLEQMKVLWANQEKYASRKMREKEEEKELQRQTVFQEA